MENKVKLKEQEIEDIIAKFEIKNLEDNWFIDALKTLLEKTKTIKDLNQSKRELINKEYLKMNIPVNEDIKNTTSYLNSLLNDMDDFNITLIESIFNLKFKYMKEEIKNENSLKEITKIEKEITNQKKKYSENSRYISKVVKFNKRNGQNNYKKIADKVNSLIYEKTKTIRFQIFNECKNEKEEKKNAE